MTLTHTVSRCLMSRSYFRWSLGDRLNPQSGFSLRPLVRGEIVSDRACAAAGNEFHILREHT